MKGTRQNFINPKLSDRILRAKGTKATFALSPQGSVFNCFIAAMTVVGVHIPEQVTLARKLHNHIATSSA